MTQTTFKRVALPLTFAAATASTMLSTSTTMAAGSTTYKGPTESYRWGTIQVSVVVKSKKIANLKTAYIFHTDRSQFIQDNSIPQLKQEVLQAQSINVNTISGATDTSFAYGASLQSALKKAVKAKALKATVLK